MTAIDAAPASQRDVPDTSRHPWRRWPIVLCLLAGVVAGLVALRAGDSPQHPAALPLEGAVAGTYVLDDGRHLTLWGNARSLRYELGGVVTALLAEGTDRYVAVDGTQTVTVRREGAGTVTGLGLQTGEGSQIAVPETLHVERDVRFASAGAHLAGSVLLPTGAGPHPAIVIVHGAERNADRENYLLLGSHFARRGVAALIYDKRGVGASTGSFAHATFDDLTADAIAAVDALAAQPDIDPHRVGVLGFSQGAWVVAQAAADSDLIAFVAAYSPSGFSPGDQQAWLHGSMLAARGFDRSGLIVADRVDRMLYSSLDLVDAGVMPPIPHVPGFWFHALDLHTDSTALWQRVAQPTLLAWGALDCQVPAHDSMRALGDALHRGGNTDVTLTVLPDADHSFTLVEPCGHETGMAHHDSMHYAEGYFDLGPDWVHTLSQPDGATPDLPIAARPDTTVLDWHLDPPPPAPWYGTLPAQLIAMLLLLGTFGVVTVRWFTAVVRRIARPGALATTEHLTGMAGLLGLFATLTGFAAFTEIAMLGDTRAAFLVGGPTVDGITALMAVARLLVVLTVGLGIATTAGLGPRRTPTRWVVAAATVTLIAWAAHWRLLPFA